MFPSPLTPTEQNIVDSAQAAPPGISVIPSSDVTSTWSTALQNAMDLVDRSRQVTASNNLSAGASVFFTNASAALPQAAGNALGGLVDKVQEGLTDLKNKFAGAGPFDRLAAGGETIEEATAKHTMAVAEIQRAVGDDRVAALDAESRLAAEDAMLHNDITAAEMQNNLQWNDAEITAIDINRQTNTSSQSDDGHKIKLTEPGGEQIIFDVMPEIYETRSVEYESISPPQSPAAFQKYKGTASVQWTINATLVCRTQNEATNNLQTLNTLRAWTMPFFGSKIANVAAWAKKTGAPPPVITLSGWRKSVMGPTPVVITGLNWTFPTDVDYLPAESKIDGALVPFPTILKVAINCVETYSTDQMNGFDRRSMLIGDIENTWSSLSSGVGYSGASMAAAREAQDTGVNGATSTVSVVSEPITVMDGEGGRLPLSATATDDVIQDYGVGP